MLLIAAVGLLSSSSSWGENAVTEGGYVGGGGELIADAQNPWFLPNTKSVKYCIEIDEVNFGQRLETIRPRIQNAFAFWKKQFQHARTYFPFPYETEKHAQQSFVEVTCQSKPDLKFQFGTISKEQLKNIPDPSRFIGLAVRTKYDPVKLKGQGFIYFSPENGPLKMDAIKDKNHKPWSHAGGPLLFPALIHELGHVFGMPHFADLQFMSDRFIEGIFSLEADLRSWQSWMAELNRLENSDFYQNLVLFKITGAAGSYASKATFCAISEPSPPNPEDKLSNRFTGYKLVRREVQFGDSQFRKTISVKKEVASTVENAKADQSVASEFFNLSEGEESCIAETLTRGSYTLTVGAPDEFKMRLVGAAKFDPAQIPSKPITKELLHLWLTPVQRVLNIKIESGGYKLGVAEFESSKEIKANFMFDKSDLVKEITLNLSESSFWTQPGGVHNGKYYINLFQGY